MTDIEHDKRLDALGAAIASARARADSDLEAPEIGDLLATLNDEIEEARGEEAQAARTRLDKVESQLADIEARFPGVTGG